MSESKHTDYSRPNPTPWRREGGNIVDANGDQIVCNGRSGNEYEWIDQGGLNLDLIVLAVNSHADLLAACEAAIKIVNHVSLHTSGYQHADASEAYAALESAIALAKGVQTSAHLTGFHARYDTPNGKGIDVATLLHDLSHGANLRTDGTPCACRFDAEGRTLCACTYHDEMRAYGVRRQS